MKVAHVLINYPTHSYICPRCRSINYLTCSEYYPVHVQCTYCTLHLILEGFHLVGCLLFSFIHISFLNSSYYSSNEGTQLIVILRIRLFQRNQLVYCPMICGPSTTLCWLSPKSLSSLSKANILLPV